VATRRGRGRQYAPTALDQALLGGPSTSPLGDAGTSVTTTAIAWSLLVAVAYAVLTTAGVLLWKRARSVATFVVIIGFATLLIDQVLLLVGTLQMIATFHRHSGDTLFVISHRANSLHVMVLGLGFAAVGLLWHALQGSRR
jgi:hypothetical protein